MKKKNMWVWMILATLILALSVGGFYALNIYNHYQQGFAAMDNYNFIAAQRHFDKLPFKDDFFADEYAYIQAGVLMDQGQYLESLAAFDKLETFPVSVSVLEKLGERISAEEDPYDALSIAGELIRISLPSATINSLKEKVYKAGQDAYRDYSFSTAKKYFEILGDYARSEDYVFLLDYRSSSAFVGNQHYEKLLSLIGFEDAHVLFVKNEYFMKRFLCGRWEDKKSSKYFEMDKDYDCTYNLPYTYTGGYYYLNYGEYSSGKTESEAVAQFKFTIIDGRTMSVYCYKDGSTHKMYKQ